MRASIAWPARMFGRRRARPTSTSRSYPMLAPQSEWAVFTITSTTGQLSPTGDWSFDLTCVPAAIPLNFDGNASQWFAGSTMLTQSPTGIFG
jgi:hypothetical protein